METGAQLASEIDLHVLLGRILDAAGRLMDSSDGAVLLYDSHRDGLLFASAIGASAQKLLDEWGEHSAKRVPIAGSKAGSVFRSGESLVESSFEDDGSHFKRIDDVPTGQHGR